jgi:hypothetical protein
VSNIEQRFCAASVMMDSIIAPRDGHRAYCIRPRAASMISISTDSPRPSSATTAITIGEGNREGCHMEVEHARLLHQGWRLATDGCYRKPEPGKIKGLPGNDANTGLKNGPTVTASST